MQYKIVALAALVASVSAQNASYSAIGGNGTVVPIPTLSSSPPYTPTPTATGGSGGSGSSASGTAAPTASGTGGPTYVPTQAPSAGNTNYVSFLGLSLALAGGIAFAL